MKMFVWQNHFSFMMVVHAASVDRARVIALREIGTTDGSCPNRDKVREIVREQAPVIWIGENAEYAIEEGSTETLQAQVFFS